MTEFLKDLAKVKIAEQLDQDDADTTNILEFADPIEAIEIWHNETDPQTFIVNSLSLQIIPGGYKAAIGGTASKEVEIPAGIDCIVTRLV